MNDVWTSIREFKQDLEENLIRFGIDCRQNFAIISSRDT